MSLLNFSKIAKGIGLLLAIIVLPMPCLGYVIGDINSDDKVGLEETIYSLQVVSGFVVPVSGTTINVPADVPTIQQAIDAAAEGDTINVAEGTYLEALTITGKSLTITGAGTGIGGTIIDGNSENGIDIDESPGVLIENLTIENGNDGIEASYHSSVEVRNITIRNCSDRGIQIEENSIGVIADSTFESNGTNGILVFANSLAFLKGAVTTQNNLGDGIRAVLGSSIFMYELTYTSNGDGSGNDGGSGINVMDNSSISLASDSTLTINDSSANSISLHRASLLHSRGTISVSDSQSNGLYASDNSTVYIRGGSLLIENCGGGFSLIRNSTAYLTSMLEVSNCDRGINIGRGSIFENTDSANIVVSTISADEAIYIYENSTWRANGGTILVEENGYGIIIAGSSTLRMKDTGAGLSATISDNLNDGINVSTSGVILEEGVVITGNSGNGISLWNQSSGHLSNIIVQNNSSWGTSALNGSSFNIYGSNTNITGNNGGGQNPNVEVGFGSLSNISEGTIGGMSCHVTALSEGTLTCP